MYFIDGDIFEGSLPQYLSCVQNSIYLLPEILSKYKHQVFFLELEQQKNKVIWLIHYCFIQECLGIF